MELSKNQIFEKYAKRCSHRIGNTLLPYACEWTSVVYGYNVVKQKKAYKSSTEKTIFIH